MPAFPDEIPPIGLNVSVLIDGIALVGFYEDGQWWVGLPDTAVNIPVNNDHVASWSLLE